MPRQKGTPYRIDLSGRTFGRWTVLSRLGGSVWSCRCECGTEKAVTGSSLNLGTSTSCGCYGASVHRTHGMERTPIYNTWAQMLSRCNNPNATSYKHYGARGIKVCERWRKFENFYADMGDKPDGKSVDRIDREKGYEPENCRWATWNQQNRNKSNTIRLEWNGKMMSIGEIAELHGMTRRKLAERLRKGMPLADAVKDIHYNRWNTPVLK